MLVLSAPACNVILKLTQGQRSRSQRSKREKTQKRHFLPKSSMVFNQNFFRGSLKDNSTHITRVLIWCERSRSQRSRCVYLLDHYRDLGLFCYLHLHVLRYHHDLWVCVSTKCPGVQRHIEIDPRSKVKVTEVKS